MRKKFLATVLALVLALTTFSFSSVKADDEIFDGYKFGENDFSFVVGGTENPNLKLSQVMFYDKSGKEPQLIKWNVIKLRAFAEALKGTDGAFGIGYDKETRTVTLTSGEEYESNGNEYAPISENPSVSAQNFKMIVNGEEKQIPGVVINGENYVLTSKLAAALGNVRFHAYPGDKHINYVDFNKSDIPAFDEAAFKESVAAHDYTIVYSWGPWCPWSRLSIPHMVQLNEKFAKEGKDVQIYGIVNQYYNYTNADIADLFEGKTAPWTEVGGTQEGYEYLDKLLNEGENQIFFFPGIFILDKNGNKVGESFDHTWGTVEEKYYKDNGLNKEDDLTDEQFDEFYPTIYDAFIAQMNFEKAPAEEKIEETTKDAK